MDGDREQMEMNGYLDLLDEVQSDIQWMRENVGYNMPNEVKLGIVGYVMRAQKRLAQFGECTGVYNLDK